MANFAVVAGYWSTNVGNSFFQLGAEYVVRKSVSNSRTYLVGDQPGYWKPGVKRNPENALLLLEHLDLDYLVIQGPFLRPEFAEVWLDTLRELTRNGVKIIVLAAGMMDYSPRTVRLCRAWLSEVPPYVLTTRDSETYRYFNDIAEHSYDGIDVAFFVSDFFAPPGVDLDDFVIFNFDKGPEPKIWRHCGDGDDRRSNQEFEFRGVTWHLRFPAIRRKLVQRSRVMQFLDSWIPERLPADLAGVPIIRTDHRFNPLIVRRLYKRPNTFCSDIPHSYLTLYANTSLTLSNRVHACVATLAYGNEAMLFSRSPRSRLLDRIGAVDITVKPQHVNLDHIAEEKNSLVEFLQSVL